MRRAEGGRPLLAFGLAVPIAALGGLIGLGGAEFRLPVLAGPLGYPGRRAVPLNLAVSLVTLAGGHPHGIRRTHLSTPGTMNVARRTRARGAALLLSLAALAALAACGGGSEGGPKGEASGSARAGGGEVMMFAAASLREALQELGTAFQRETGTRVVFNFAGSNDLAHQIQATRGPDLFLSASSAWMDTVQNAGRVVPQTRRDLLANSLVIVAHAADTSTLADPCALATHPFRNLAMGDPEAVPAGTYARTWLRSVRCGGRPLWDTVQARVAPAPDVRAALGLVLADPRVLGIVYRTDQRAFADRTRVLLEVRGGPPIRYVLARLAHAADPAAATRFYDYLAGPRGAEVFRRHGFMPLPAP